MRRRDRDVLLLRFFEGLDGPSLARALGVSEPTARQRLARAIGRLRKLLAAAGATFSLALLDAAHTSAPPVPPDLARRAASDALAPSPARVDAVRRLSQALWRAQARVPVLLLVAALLISAGGLVLRRGMDRGRTTAAVAIAPPSRPRRPGVLLTMAWNGQGLTVPLPATFPDELRETPAYHDWEAAADARNLTWSTRDGRRYVCHAEVRDIGGRRAALISSVELFRADGTLQSRTINDDRGEPGTWHVYAADGKTLVASFTNCPAGAPGAPFVQSLRLVQPDGSTREYDANRNGTVYAEWMLDGGGRRLRLLNGGDGYDDDRRSDLRNREATAGVRGAGGVR